MAAFDFPNSPVNGQVYTAGGYAYRWNGTAWMIGADEGESGTDYVNVSGDTMLGKLGLIASTTATAPLNIPQGATPTTPINGDVWATSAGLYVRIGGATIGPLGTGGGGGSVDAWTKTESDLRYEPIDTAYTKAESVALFEPIDSAYTKAESDGRYEPLDSAYTKAESDARYEPFDSAYTKVEADARYPAITDVYTKTQADGRYEPLDSAYTKSESDGRYEPLDSAYTKAESDNLYVEEASLDGNVYGRKSGAWIEIPGVGSISPTEYNLNTASYVPPPNSGNIRLNNANQTLATVMYIHYVNIVGVDVSTVLKLLRPGNNLLLQDKSNAGNYQYYQISGTITDNTTYISVPVTRVSGGSPCTAGRVMLAAFGVGGDAVREAPNDGQEYVRKNQAWSVASGGVTDGDKTDIIVSGTGATWTIDPTVITATARTLLDDATTGAMLTTLGAAPVSHTHAWTDITSKPTTFTPSAHNHVASEVTDFAEAVDDRVNGLLVAGPNVTLTYNDTSNTLTIGASGEGGGGSIGDGDKGDIVVSGSGATWTIDSGVLTTAGRALIDDADNTAQRTTLGLGTLAVKNTITTSDIAGDAVALDQMANGPANTMVGNNTASTADLKYLTISEIRGLLSITNVDNTADSAKPVSTAQASAIAAKEPTITAGSAYQYWIGTKTWTAIPHNFSIWVGSKPANFERVFAHKAAVAFTIPSSFTGSQGEARAAATGSSVFSIRKNNSEFGTITFAAAGTVPTFVAASAASFAIGDILEIFGPATQDATLADIMFTLVAARS